MSNASIFSTHSGASTAIFGGRSSHLPQIGDSNHANLLFKPYRQDTASVNSEHHLRQRGSITSFDSYMFGGRKNIIHEDNEISESSDDEYYLQRSNASTAARLRKVRKIRYDLFELEDKVSRNMHEFKMYHDSDLPFLNQKTEGSNLIKQNIISGDVDDDCQTDDEQKEDAKKMLRDEVKNAINKFFQDKRDGTAENNIKNLNLKKRFSRVPFDLPCTE